MPSEHVEPLSAEERAKIERRVASSPHAIIRSQGSEARLLATLRAKDEEIERLREALRPWVNPCECHGRQYGEHSIMCERSRQALGEAD